MAAGASASTALTENVIITMPTSGRTVPMPKGFRKEIWSRPETSSVIWGGRDTGAEENVNNIDVCHLHLGLQLIFDESQREGDHEIWIDVYPLVQFLSEHASEVLRDDTTREWYRRYEIKDSGNFTENL